MLALAPAARLWLGAAIGLQVLAALCVLAQAWLIGTTVGGVFLRGQALADVMSLLAAMLALLLVRAVSVALAEWLAQRAASLVKRAVRQQVSAHLLALGPRYTRTEQGGALVQTLTESVEALDEYVSQFLPARAIAGIVPVLVVVAVFIIDPLTTIVLLFAGPILVLLLALIGQKTRALTERRFAEMRWMGAYFLDMLRGLPTLKLFGRSREQSATMEQIGARYGTTTMDVLRTAFQTSLVLEWGSTAATALVALQVGWRLIERLMPFEPALIVLLLTPEFFLPLRQLALKYHAGTAGKTAAGQLAAILSQPAATPDASALPAPPADITFDGVRVTHRDGAAPALDGVSFTLRRGHVTALVGPTGAGKSTIAGVLLRFVMPDAGQVQVGDAPLAGLDVAAWRAQIGYIPQHPHLFDGTVADNIRLGRPDASLAEVETAARAAHAHAFICSLPQGYDTPLGEAGARLSGGQRQRLALARALLLDAPLLILDEPTAHLDSASETAIRLALVDLSRTRTVLLIAHRLRMSFAADQIIVLEQGRVAATGTHTDLLDSSPLYRTMVARYEEILV